MRSGIFVGLALGVDRLQRRPKRRSKRLDVRGVARVKTEPAPLAHDSNPSRSMASQASSHSRSFLRLLEKILRIS